MRKVKILGGLVGGAVVLLGAALLALWLWVNPNNYKDKIALSVKESTGRELRLGELKLSVFPWVALDLGPGSLANLPGDGEEPFLSFAHVTLKVALLPLLQRRLQVTRIEIDGLDLRLAKDAEGKGNWRHVETKLEASPGIVAGRAGDERSFQRLAELRVRDGQVRYQDVIVDNLNLETGSIAANQQIPVGLSFAANRGVAGERITVNARFDMNAASSLQELQLAAVSLSGSSTHPGDSRQAHWELTAPNIAANLTRPILRVPVFAANYASAHLTGVVVATNVLDELSLTGSVILAPLVLQEFAPRFGVLLPKTRDPKVLSQLSGSTDFAYDLKSLSLSNLQARLDDTQFQGNLRFLSRNGQSLEFDLSADQIDLDRYRAAGGQGVEHDHKSPDPPRGHERPISVTGIFKLASARFSGLDLTQLHLSVDSKDGITRLFPVEAQLDGGRYSGDITLDWRSPVPVLSFDEHLTGVDMAQVLANSAQRGHLSGRATVHLQGSARGSTVDTLIRTWNGHLDADLAEGAFEGIDLEFEMSRAQALFDRAQTRHENTRRTKFDTFRASAQITNGIAETSDLNISSPALRLTGQGSANLPTKAINFQLTASILKAPSTTVVDIPLKVGGTYTDPNVKSDFGAVAKGQLKEKLQDILKKNGLQGLFGK